MSLNSREVAATSTELHELRAGIALDDAACEQALGYAPGELAQALNIQLGPVETWRVRDFLVEVAHAEGAPVPRFSRLTDAMRGQAQMWFGSWSVPDVPVA
ncbi:DUF2316 family protein [uncultured Corynebacterium sp.]|uniref:DUF2316 family protein n=1 Tax=uncultured Corynebacterium sp. TaxID=159447 RepID=UPI0025F24E38|nr:DUF2316 family protein [uncultured Corynebacterium sp.]